LWLLLALSLNASPLLADRLPSPPPTGGTEDHVRAEVHRASSTSGMLLIILRIDPGYHINANPASNEYLIPTSVAVTGAVPERIAYPPALRFKPKFADDPIDVYEGTVSIAVILPSALHDRMSDLKIKVTAQACTEEICLPPAELPAQ
jgi:uncharacterized protein